MLRSNDSDPGGKVGQTHGGLGLVLPLTPRTTGFVGFHDHLLCKHFGIGVMFRLCKFCHGTSSVRENSKFEFRSSKQIQNSNVQILKMGVGEALASLMGD